MWSKYFLSEGKQKKKTFNVRMLTCFRIAFYIVHKEFCRAKKYFSCIFLDWQSRIIIHREENCDRNFSNNFSSRRIVKCASRDKLQCFISFAKLNFSSSFILTEMFSYLIAYRIVHKMKWKKYSRKQQFKKISIYGCHKKWGLVSLFIPY